MKQFRTPFYSLNKVVRVSAWDSPAICLHCQKIRLSWFKFSLILFLQFRDCTKLPQMMNQLQSFFYYLTILLVVIWASLCQILYIQVALDKRESNNMCWRVETAHNLDNVLIFWSKTGKMINYATARLNILNYHVL